LKGASVRLAKNLYSYNYFSYDTLVRLKRQLTLPLLKVLGRDRPTWVLFELLFSVCDVRRYPNNKKVLFIYVSHTQLAPYDYPMTD